MFVIRAKKGTATCMYRYVVFELAGIRSIFDFTCRGNVIVIVSSKKASVDAWVREHKNSELGVLSTSTCSSEYQVRYCTTSWQTMIPRQTRRSQETHGFATPHSKRALGLWSPFAMSAIVSSKYTTVDSVT